MIWQFQLKCLTNNQGFCFCFLGSSFIFFNIFLLLLAKKGSYSFYFKISHLSLMQFRGALIIRAEIIPIEPDPGNAGEGITVFLFFLRSLSDEPLLG